MKLEYIDPFVSSTISVLKTVLHCDIAQGDVALRRGHDLAGTVSVVIGLRDNPGDSVILNMDEQTAFRVSEAMNGAPCTELDGAALDAIGELANMIAGNAITALNQQGLNFNVKPPQTIRKADLPGVTEGLELFQVPVTSAYGLLTVNFTIRTE